MRNAFLFGYACLFATAGSAAAQETVSYEQGANGVTYKVTRRVNTRLAPTTQMQAREEKVYTPRVTTQYQTYQQAYLTPVTEYRWVSRMRGRWNPFVQPYWSQQLEPFTRWESRESTVQMPTTKTDWVEERRVVQVPVTTYQTVQNETISRVAVNSVPAATPALPAPSRFTPVQTPMVASLPTSRLPTTSADSTTAGGQRLQSDPPRAASGWRSQDGTLRR